MSRCPAVVHVPDGPGFLVCDQRCYLRAQICLLLFFCDLNCGLGVIRALFDCGSSTFWLVASLLPQASLPSRFFGPWPSFPSSFAHHSALTWPLFRQFKHSKSCFLPTFAAWRRSKLSTTSFRAIAEVKAC